MAERESSSAIVRGYFINILTFINGRKYHSKTFHTEEEALKAKGSIEPLLTPHIKVRTIEVCRDCKKEKEIFGDGTCTICYRASRVQGL